MKTFILPIGYAALIAYLETRPKDKKWIVEVKEYRHDRSNEQNRFYWKCIVGPLAEFNGDSPSAMHDNLLGSYFGWDTSTFRGHTREVPKRRTTEPEKMSVEDFQRFILHCQTIMSELGIPVESMDNWQA